MQYLTVDYLPMVFTRNMMNTLMNHLASEDRYLYHCAMTTVSAMIAAGQQDQQKRIVILLSLIGEQGNAMFDRITGTNTVALLLEDMDADGLVRYVSHLLKRFAQHQKR
jgi:DNA polymerase phi